jgi:hypothetical protein
MKNFKFLLYSVLALTVFPVSADVFVYDIVTPDASLSSYGPTLFATATVNLINPSTAQITFTSADGYLLGDGQAVNWFASTLAGLTNFSSSQLPGFIPAPINGAGFGPVSTFGTFNSDQVTGGTFLNAYKSITIQLGAISPVWTSASNVLAPNDLGYIVAAHIYVCATANCSVTSGSVADGFAANGTLTVPEPSTYLILGSILTMAILLKKRKAKTV